MRYSAPILAALLLAVSGCGVADKPRPAAEQGEVRHPSNEMNPLPKEEPKHKEPAKVAAAKRMTPKPPAFEDPQKIPAGINYSEMVRRFGPPNMEVKEGPTRTTYSYSKLKTQVQVEVQNGKVTSVASANTGL